MSLTHLSSTNNDDNFSSETGVIIRDVVPRSMNDDCCSCTCSCCPNISDWCIKDAFGLTCSFLTWLLFLYGQFVIVFVILVPKNYSFLFLFTQLSIFHLLEFLAISSHCRAMFSNPGAVPLKNATPENLLTYQNGAIVYRCAACQSIRPPRAHHCSVCKRCIKRMDHHCIFVNNCVGQNNQKYFILFTFYTFILTVYGMILLFFHMTTCIKSNWVACPAWSPPATLIFGIFLGLETFAFSIFTGIMTGTQLYSIFTDTTGIEFLKSETIYKRHKNSFMSSMKLVFGSRVGLTWLNPYSKPRYLIRQNDERVIFDV